MAVQLSNEWGPYLGGADAKNRLCAYVDRVCGPGVGVAWAANGALFPMRAPTRVNGFGDVAIFHWSPPPPRKRPPPMDFWSRAKRFLDRYMEQEGQAQMAEAQSNVAMGQAIGRGIQRMFTTHQDDAAGVLLDIICIAASIALIPTGLGFLGIAALAGGAVLLSCDGAAYAMEIAGDDERAERIKRDTEWVRLAATVVTLPDFGWNGVKAIRELRELRELRTMAATTGQAAQRLGSRATNAARAARYEQIIARANLRTQIRTEQIRASLRLEMAPRGLASASIGLLLREEVQGDESAIHQINRWLKVHLTAAHKS